MSESLTFNDVLEAASQLSLDEQESLLDIMNRRISEIRREQLIRDVEQAEKEFEARNYRIVTPDEIMDEILS